MDKLLILVLVMSRIREFTIEYKAKRICVIGAGVGGLTVTRYLKEIGVNFTVFEATRHVGGTWRYDPRVGRDENGLPLHTGMYPHYRMNVPRAIMAFRGYPMPESLHNFPRAADYYNYIQKFAIHSGLLDFIKFQYMVTLVTRQYTRWKVKYKDVVTQEEFEEYFDYVIICSGQFSKPRWPNITGENVYKGTIIHSHDYRTPYRYKNNRVLIVGGGASSLDIVLNLVNDSKIFHSHRRGEFCRISPDPVQNYVKKRDVDFLTEYGVLFKDGTYEEVDHIIYCTGYEYDYPYLDETCGLKLESDFISPLHKHLVNINEPTMFFMGLVTDATTVMVLDAQARYIAALLKGDFKLPSRHNMMLEWQHLMLDIIVKRFPPSHLFSLNTIEGSYFGSLTAESHIDLVPPVLFRARYASQSIRCLDYLKFRAYEYEILGYNKLNVRRPNETRVGGPIVFNKSAEVW